VNEPNDLIEAGRKISEKRSNKDRRVDTSGSDGNGLKKTERERERERERDGY
jgi:hypothetical protein